VSLDEEHLLFSELGRHLASMALFKVITGLREQEVVQRSWRWAVTVPELGTSIFVVPRQALGAHLHGQRAAVSKIAKCCSGTSRST
jgi:hypothetical protein